MTIAQPMEQFAELETGIRLAYEEFGDPPSPAVLLIMGVGSQMIAWPAGLCQKIAERGYRVIRFDNRDAGHSTKLDNLGRAPLDRLLRGEKPEVPYRLEEMAADGVGLLDALGIERAHIVGASMGGMIAQRLAIDSPTRVLSLASLMSTTGDPAVGQSTPELRELLLSPPAKTRDAHIENTIAGRRMIGSAEHLRDEELTRELAGLAFDRGLHPQGTARQLAAVAVSPDRTPELAGIEAPTVVVHGAADPLIGVSGGKATAAAIPGARLVVIEDMGHDLPPALWDEITAALTANFERAS